MKKFLNYFTFLSLEFSNKAWTVFTKILKAASYAGRDGTVFIGNKVLTLDL